MRNGCTISATITFKCACENLSNATGGPGRGSIDRGEFPERWVLTPKNNPMIAFLSMGRFANSVPEAFLQLSGCNPCDWSSSALGQNRQ
jgi:hypothetical protein